MLGGEDVRRRRCKEEMKGGVRSLRDSEEKKSKLSLNFWYFSSRNELCRQYLFVVQNCYVKFVIVK